MDDKVMEAPAHAGDISFSVPIVESYEDGGSIYLVGLASISDEESLNGNMLTDKAVERLRETCKGLPGFINHDPDLVFGKIVDVAESSPNEFRPVFEVLPPHSNPEVAAAREKVLYWLENGVPIGLSIGGHLSEWRLVENEDGGYTAVVDDLTLLEVSVTPIPALRSTQGTVDRLNMSISAEIAESLHITEAAWRLNQDAYSKAASLISNGKYTTDKWSKPTLSDFGGDVKEYSKYCLAYDPGGDPENASTYAYPYGKEGKVYVNALKAIKSAAAGGRGAAKNAEIYDAADKLLGMIDEKEESVMEDELKNVLSELKETVDAIAEKVQGVEEAEAKVEEPRLTDEEKISEAVDRIAGERIPQLVEEKVEEAIKGLIEDDAIVEALSGRVLEFALHDRVTRRPVVEEASNSKVEEDAGEGYTSLELIKRVQ